MDGSLSRTGAGVSLVQCDLQLWLVGEVGFADDEV